MFKSKLVTAFLSLGITLPLCALGCGGDFKIDSPDRSWIKSDVALYGLLSTGGLFKASLGSNQVTLLVDHHFGAVSGVRLSPDRRYVLYYDANANGLDGIYYLYDFKLEKEREIRALGNPQFSPDSTKILWDSAPLVIVDLSSLQGLAIQNPDQAPGTKKFILANGWSQDGKSVYIETMNDNTFKYFKYDVVTREVAPITGSQTEHEGGQFLEGGKPVALYEYCVMQSDCGEWKVKSPSGQYSASVDEDKDHNLYLLDSEGKPTLIEKSEWSFCEGDSIRQIAWLGSDDYLVYKVHGIPYVFGVKTKKKSVLFDPRTVPYYFWK